MSVKITKKQAIEIAQTLGVNVEPKREIILDETEIAQLAKIADLDSQSCVEISFMLNSTLTAELLRKGLIVDITNYNNQL